MTSAKFVLIGGGSYGWTPVLLTDMALNPDLKGLHVVLQDINPAPLAIVVPLARPGNRAKAIGQEGVGCEDSGDDDT